MHILQSHDQRSETSDPWKIYDGEDGMREKAEQLLVLPEEQEKVYLIFAMREEDNGSVFHCYYSLTDDTDSAYGRK